MKIELLQGAPPPPERALIVCAGTVTCHTVAAMGSGFNMFKRYFDHNQHSNSESSKGWQEDLNQKLTGYQYKRALPLYCQIAQQGSYIGGVATVACIQGRNHITPTHQHLAQADLEEQYKAAVRLAIEDAIKLNRPLYIQPLGIGVYGWEPALAATLFGEVLAEFHATALEVYIPIFDQNEQSKDRQFSAKLQSDMAQGLQPRVRSSTRPEAVHNVSAFSRSLYHRSFLLKCLALLSGIISAAFILMAALALLSIIVTTPINTMILGATGIASGVSSYFMFRMAKIGRDVAEDTASLANRH